MSVYNKVAPKDLIQSIKSMLDQSVPPEQFVIVEDGPLDKHLSKIIDSYLRKHPKLFTVVKLDKNMGLAYALNEGLCVARNELIARMDCDDWSFPKRCEKQIMKFNEDNELVICGTCVSFYKDDIKKPLNYTRKYPIHADEIRKALKRSDPFCHPSVMYKKSAVVNSGCYDPSFRRRQDYDLFSRMIITNKGKGYNIDECLLLFKMDDDYFLRNKSKESCKNRVLVQKKILKRGGCSVLDYLIVKISMLFIRMMPSFMYRKIHKSFNRGKANG